MKKIITTFFFFNVPLLFGSEKIKSAQSFIDTIIEFSKISKSSSSSAKAQSDQLLKKASVKVDMQKLASKSLGKNRTKIGTQQFEKFQELLKQLIELSAYPKAKKITAQASGLQYLPGKHKNQVKVLGLIEREKFGEVIENDFELIFYFGDDLKIDDAVIEGELLSENLERQLSKALEKKTFDYVLSSMQKKVRQLKE